MNNVIPDEYWNYEDLMYELENVHKYLYKNIIKLSNLSRNMWKFIEKNNLVKDFDKFMKESIIPGKTEL